MEKISLKKIAEWCGVETALDGFVEKISTDSREIDGTTLFIALKGERFDANDFVPDVLNKGAKAVVCSKYDGNDERVILVEDTGKALLDIAAGYRQNFNIPFVALTGSVGKTTTKGMIYAVLSEKFNTLRTEGNLNNEIGVPKTLFRLENSHEAAVIEMGMNHFGEISRLSKTVCPDIGVITNVGTAHIENLGSRNGILKAKSEILDGMKAGSPLVINGDSDILNKVQADDYKVIRFGLDGGDVTAENIDPTSLGSGFTVKYKNETARAFVPSQGIHNVYNGLCAIAVGLLLGMTLEECVRGLRNFAPEGMRQKITSVKGMTFIEDCYNANLDSMCAALETLKSLKIRRTVAVLGDMLELGDFSKEAHQRVGEKAFETECGLVVTFGDAAEDIAKAFIESGGVAKAFKDKTELTNYLRENLKEGDTVLFKGSRGMKMEEIFTSLYKEWEV
ncbi:MAG: UDP-N-acetylmuramoyl-tripeptide--D-alanyl-D-alanine ligase [Acutalibacteraceae bacterium]|nr:UDP-N-acetylmuramoyl-tripeptide--D-alanyl-D-alanine ligase [Acutalibacteraceae bacterium]